MGAVKNPRSTANSVAQPPRKQIAKGRKPAAGQPQQERARNRMLVEELANSLAQSAAIEEHMLVPFDHEAAPRYAEKKERVESQSPGATEVNRQRSRFSFAGVLTPAKSGPSTASTPSIAAAGFFSPFLSAIRRVANRSEGPLGITESAENTEACSSGMQQDVSKTPGGGQASSDTSRSLFGKDVSTDTRGELDSREPEVLSSAQRDVFLQSTKPTTDGREPAPSQAHVPIEADGHRKNRTSSAGNRTKTKGFELKSCEGYLATEDQATVERASDTQEAPIIEQVDVKQLVEAAQSMTVVSLRAMLRKANLSSSGKKSELVARAAEARLPDLMSQIQRKGANLSRAEHPAKPRTAVQHKMREEERQIELETQVLAEYVQLERTEAQKQAETAKTFRKRQDEELARQQKAAEEARREQKIKEAEALRRQQEAEEFKRYREAEVLRRQQEAEEARRIKEAEMLRRQQEAEELIRRHEAEVLRKQQEAEEARRIQEAEVLRRQREAEELRRHHEAEVLRKQQEAEEARRIEEAEMLRRQQEAEELKRRHEAEVLRKQQEAEEAQRIKEAEESRRRQEEALEVRRKKREALEARKKQKAAEEAQKKQHEADEAYRKQKKAEEAREQRATAARARGKQEQTRAQRNRFEAAPTRAKTQRGPKTQNFESQASAEEVEGKLENLHLAGNKAAEQSKGSINLKTAERAASRAGANQPEIGNHLMECSAEDRIDLQRGNAMARRSGYRGAAAGQQKVVKGMPAQNTLIPQPRSGLVHGQRHPSEAGPTHGIVPYGEQGILNRRWNGQEASNFGISHPTEQDHGETESPDLHGAVQYPIVSLDAPLYQTDVATSLRAKSSSSEYEQLSQRSAVLEQQYRELHSQLVQPVTTAAAHSAKQNSAANRESHNVQSIDSVVYSHEHSKENDDPAANEQASDKPGKKSSDAPSIDLTKETEGQQTTRREKVHDSVSKRSTRAGLKQPVKPTTTTGAAKPKPATATNALSSRPRTRSQKAK